MLWAVPLAQADGLWNWRAVLCLQPACEQGLGASCGPWEPGWLARRRDSPVPGLISPSTPYSKELVGKYSCFLVLWRAHCKGCSTQFLRVSSKIKTQLPSTAHPWLSFPPSLPHVPSPSLCCLGFPPQLNYCFLNLFPRACF